MKKILIVEDELAYLSLLSDQLSKMGYTIIEAINGKVGLEKAKSEKPDLILLDIRMPVMDGMTMLDLLRKEVGGRSVKVIMLTNLEPDNKIIGEVVNGQPAYYFVKSNVKLDDLFVKIKEILAE